MLCVQVCGKQNQAHLLKASERTNILLKKAVVVLLTSANNVFLLKRFSVLFKIPIFIFMGQLYIFHGFITFFLLLLMMENTSKLIFGKWFILWFRSSFFINFLQFPFLTHFYFPLWCHLNYGLFVPSSY